MSPRPNALSLLGRRLAALSYDSLLLIAVLFFASLPLNLLHGDAIRAGATAFQLYLLGIMFIYFGWQWTHGGQTLGMKAWRLQLGGTNNEAVSWQQALIRFCGAWLSLACAGLGFIWILVDRERRSWHDRLAGTQVLLLDKPQAAAADTIS